MNNTIRTGEIKQGDKFWHDGILYNAVGDARPTAVGGVTVRVPVDSWNDNGVHELRLHVGGGGVARASRKV